MNKKSSNKSLHKAGVVKNDEFYTRLTDIENELKHYKNQFHGKVVFCNCDDPKESNFIKYFSMNFEHLGLKKLIATHYKGSTLFTKEAPYKLEYAGDKNGNRMPDPNEFMTKMIGTGDFRSEECIELLKEADVVVTNPPFSLFREYVAQLMEYKKNFLIIGNDNAIKYKGIFELIKENKIWLGYSKAKEFHKPDGSTQKFGNVGWFTNLDVEKRHQKLTLYKNYSSSEYPKYDNFNAIEVSKVSEIPKDYNGEMGVPITFLDKHDPEQFEIIDLLNRYTLCDTQKTNEDVRIRHSHTCNINGRAVYSRIVIKNKVLKKK
jgi:hypothetical protein